MERVKKILMNEKEILLKRISNEENHIKKTNADLKITHNKNTISLFINEKERADEQIKSYKKSLEEIEAAIEIINEKITTSQGIL
ncbi:hypothetical protein [Gracilibacillus massiliensis]|uniref:hypothetical protein n=1 Tax=Gracilibacillus massiliensis TaxID=1564956 RepID=UPI00071CE443|nr:hypothetical protein [Gracilibacillus massiliensis]